MKKIYLSLIAAAALTSATAQNARLTVLPGEKATIAERKLEQNNGPEFNAAKTTANAIVQDTNWYFFNKHLYRNTSTNAGSFYTYKNAANYATNVINSGGAVFNNTGNAVISGAECVVIRQASSPSATVPVALHVFNVAAGLPTGASLGSCTTGIANSTQGQFIGCNFSSTVLVTGAFAIIMKNVSTNPADTIRMFMNNARTATAQITPAANEMKYGESLGVFSFGATFGTSWDNTTDIFNLGAGNTGSDFEFIVAPRMSYLFTADHASTTMTTCNTTSNLYLNTTSANALSKQFNLNVFYRDWKPFLNTPTITAAQQDSAITWNFGGNPASTEYVVSPNHAFTVTANGPVNNTLLIKLQKMSDYSTGNTVSDSKAWTVTVTICNVGLTQNSIETQVGLYPNPATDKVTVFVNNANKDTQILVMNALGQVVITRNNLTEKNELNTESLTKGVYFVRVGSGDSYTTTKLVISK